MKILSDLRRRKVFRTAAAYLAAVFVILQVADLTFEPLGFSSDAYRLLVIVVAVGFPIAVVASWFFDVRAEKRATPAAAPQGTGAYRRSMWAAALFVLLCAGTLGWFAAFRWQRADYDGAHAIAVLPFDVIGDPDLAYLETGIVEMVSRNIDGAANLRAVGADMVLAAFKKRRTPEEIAEALAARYVVSGNIARAGDQLRVSATVRDVGKAASKPITREITGSASALFEVIDRLSAQILAATRAGEGAQRAASAALTTTSLAALREYLEGEEHYRKTQYDSAALHFARASDLDTTFALAYYRLSVAHVARNKTRAARKPLARAVELRGRLATRDQRMVQSFAAAYDGYWREAESQLRELLRSYPQDLEVMYNLGELLSIANPFHGQPVKEAAELLEKVIQVDPQFLCPI